MTTKDIEKAKQYLDNEGYGTGSNFTLNTVANLMAEYATKNCVSHQLKIVDNALSEVSWHNNMPKSLKLEYISMLTKHIDAFMKDIDHNNDL